MAKILIIEDEKILGEMYLSKLQQSRFDVVLAESAEKGIEALEQSIPDLIILDILLPGKNGLEFLRKMREKERYRQIPVIVLSNYDDPKAKKEALAMDVKKYLIKSNHTPQEIVDEISAYLTN